MIIEALNNYIQGNYAHFDAQVSENLCQIRAYQLIQTLEENKEYCKNKLSNFIQQVKEIQHRCESLLVQYEALKNKQPSHYLKFIRQSTTLKQVLDEHKLDVNFLEPVYFLTQAYVLSKYKLTGEFETSHGIDYEKICQSLGNISKTYARKIIHRLQRNLSEFSCQFLFKLLYGLNAEQYELCLLKSLYFKDEVGRHVLPCYEVTKILLMHALHSNKHIQVVVARIAQNEKDTIEFTLQPSQKQNCYIVDYKSVGQTKRGIMLFTGLARYKQERLESREHYLKRFSAAGFETIVLCNMAQHPQYPGILLDNKKYNPYMELDLSSQPHDYSKKRRSTEEEFLKYKYLAAQLGCSRKDAGLFLLTHIRCNTATN
ncbi:MAG TPA: hypothetical protein VG895_00540 [Patescibacteria group bacterium]|nr:hypothetical protein [Gammaproteobacteria bacterium]HWA51530.1 hypothetical protein [Patescibacteria group bacterium]